MSTSPAERWKEIVAGPEEGIDLAEAALAIAAEEYPGLDTAAYVARLEDMASVLRRRLRRDIAAAETIIALNHHVFDELGFAGNKAEYYDPRNSFLNEVIDRRLGIPITLSIVYLEIGRRVGLALHGVSFPGHFLVKCALRDGAIVLDPYARGASLGLDDLQERLRALRGGVETPPGVLRHMLAAAGTKEILARMLRNLKGIYLKQRDMSRALRITERIITLAPDAPEEYRDRGSAFEELECFRAALEDFRRYLQLKPEAGDARSIRQKITELQQIAARLN